MVSLDKASLLRILLLCGMLLANFGINIPEETLDWIAQIVVALIALYTAYKNNYLFTKGLKQKDVLEQEGLK